jgi:hypothetical protein
MAKIGLEFENMDPFMRSTMMDDFSLEDDPTEPDDREDAHVVASRSK